MTNKTMEQNHRSEQRGGKILPAICNVVGWLLIIGSIILYLPVTMPGVIGYEVYNVVSGSMEPELSVGTAVYTKRITPDFMKKGDIIAFRSNNMVITHRIVDIDKVERQFTTKGDANDTNDLIPIPFNAVIGRVEFSVPMLGALYVYFTSSYGKLYVIGLILAGAILTLIGGKLRKGAAIEEKDEK